MKPSPVKVYKWKPELQAAVNKRFNREPSKEGLPSKAPSKSVKRKLEKLARMDEVDSILNFNF